MQGAQETLVEMVGMLAGAAKPAAERGFRGREDAGGGTDTQAFSDGMECLGDALGRRFQSIEWSVSSGGDLSFAGLAEKIPDRLVATTLAPRLRAAQVPVWWP